VVPAQLAAASGPLLNEVVNLFRGSAGRLPTLLAAGALRLWVALAILEILAFAVDLWRGKEDPVKPIVARALWLSFTLALVVGLPSAHITPTLIIEGAEHVSQLLTGFKGFDPSTIFDQGVQIFVDHMKTAWDSGYFGFDAVLLDFGGIFWTSFIHLLAYIAIALAAFLILVQGAVALAFAPLAAAFGACRWTIGITESYAGFLLWWSFKLISFAIILAVGNDIATWTDSLIQLSASSGTFLRIGMAWRFAFISLAYATAALLVPGHLAQKLTQSTPVALRQFLR
jgi:hypothetical protein